MSAAPEAQRSRHAVKRALAALDWQEVVTFGFVSSEVERALDASAAPVDVLNPIAAHLNVMRTSLLPGLIGTLQTNVNRKAARVRLFETGRIFRHAGAGFEQPMRLGGLAFGGALPEQWGEAARPVGFFDVKADLEALTAPRRLTTIAAAHPALHPGRAAAVLIDGHTVGWLGELHPKLVRQFELPHAPVVFELDLDPLLETALPVGRPVSRLPIVRRDFALVVDNALPAQTLLDALEAAKPAHVIALSVFDVYRGPGLTDGKKSLAILVLMQDTSRTLTDADIDATEAALLLVAREKFGASLRH